MRTLIFTIAVLFSTLTITAQEVANEEATVSSVNVKSSKTDFFKALVKANNFDITIKENKKEVASNKNTTKTEFYQTLLEKNGFTTDIRKTTRLTNVLNTKQNTEMTQKNAVASLLP
ncbi:hypothetical protein [Aquimarina litoralis]|uniref:hypothetical protein n=1 Tax=Aquimarina litoralis TaxID=584605 RepID=UPI001C57A74D|nr:hypothetical protein [Aquimarina litoralis]MBW1298822.1 hypothetical protein [Aquimarina litoralis]